MRPVCVPKNDIYMSLLDPFSTMRVTHARIDDAYANEDESVMHYRFSLEKL